ncbi:FecR family protein [Membranihabitans marinus]|uniref:FecR family protein n=1 Tax=Membranihabitans marinus TaxID=1227546 RepID=UPI001F3C09CE|nr:FecR domain-containing protein [Membranihabitans marinus]
MIDKQIIDQLINDDQFRKWVKNGEYDLYWSQWDQSHPEYHEEFLLAQDMISGIPFDRRPLPIDEVNRAKNRFWNEVEQVEKQRTPISIMTWKRALSAAAAIALLILGYMMLVSPSEVVEKVAVVENEMIQNIALPDSTMVVLNAYADITYHHDREENLRSVYLEGEAFFNVKKLKENNVYQKFQVETKDMKISVLGTSFNVMATDDGTTVVLEEGSIELLVEGYDRPMLMNPGDKVYYSKSKGLFKEELVLAPDYSSWKEGVLTLTGKNLGEVVAWLEQRYNIDIEIDTSRADIRLSGSVNTASTSETITTVSIAAGLEAIQLDDKSWKME